MKFTTTPDKTALVFSPWEIRPGTPVTVSYSYVEKREWTWDSDAAFNDVVEGTPYTTSVKCEYPIEDDKITITGSGIYIDPISKGLIDLTVYDKRETSATIIAVAAISSTAADYYNDWFYNEEGVATPMTIVPLTLQQNEQDYKPEDFTISYSQPERGISVINDETWTCDSAGTVKMTSPADDFSMSRNLFRAGVTEVEVPLACTIEPILRYTFLNGARYKKVVDVDLQDWDGTTYDVRGILWHRDYLYTLTSGGLFSFSRWGNFDTPDFSYPEVIGNDLTYALDDKFLISSGGAIKVYSVLHDFVHYHKDTEVIRHREYNAQFRIDE
jgi:hypothetical protein